MIHVKNAEWMPSRFTVEIKHGFKIILPQFEVKDPAGLPICADYAGRIILVALILNEEVPDYYMQELSRGYKSTVCQLRKVLKPYDIKIHRIRNVGYTLNAHWRDNERRSIGK